MKKLIIAAALALFGTAQAQAATYDYSFSGNFERWFSGTDSTGTVRGPYTGPFSGNFTYDSDQNAITDWDVTMDFRYNSGTIETINFFEGGDRHRTDLSATRVTFRYSYNFASSPLQNRIRLYLDDSSSWGDTTVTFDYVWGDVDTFTGGRGFVGTSPHNNDTGADPVAIVASAAPVPLPAGLPLAVAGLGALWALGRTRRSA